MRVPVFGAIAKLEIVPLTVLVVRARLPFSAMRAQVDAVWLFITAGDAGASSPLGNTASSAAFPVGWRGRQFAHDDDQIFLCSEDLF